MLISAAFVAMLALLVLISLALAVASAVNVLLSLLYVFFSEAMSAVFVAMFFLFVAVFAVLVAISAVLLSMMSLSLLLNQIEHFMLMLGQTYTLLQAILLVWVLDLRSIHSILTAI